MYETEYGAWVAGMYMPLLTTLANEKRFAIVRLLFKKGSMNVSQIVEDTKFDQSTVSHCLGRLRSCELVILKPKGKERVYSLNETTVVPMIKLIEEHLKTCVNCIQLDVMEG